MVSAYPAIVTMVDKEDRKVAIQLEDFPKSKFSVKKLNRLFVDGSTGSIDLCKHQRDQVFHADLYDFLVETHQELRMISTGLSGVSLSWSSPRISRRPVGSSVDV